MTMRLERLTGALAMVGGGGWLLLGDRGVAFDATLRAIVPFQLLVIMLLAGLAGLHARQATRSSWTAWLVGFATANGLALMLAGQIGAPWGLPTDRGGAVETQLYALTAFVLSLGSLGYGLSALRWRGSLRLAALAIIVGSPAPLLAFDSDRGAIAALLWLVFGAGWIAFGALLLRGTAPQPRMRLGRPCFCPLSG